MPSPAASFCSTSKVGEVCWFSIFDRVERASSARDAASPSVSAFSVRIVRTRWPSLNGCGMSGFGALTPAGGWADFFAFGCAFLPIYGDSKPPPAARPFSVAASKPATFW